MHSDAQHSTFDSVFEFSKLEGSKLLLWSVLSKFLVLFK